LPSHDMNSHDVTLPPMVSPIPHATTTIAPTRQDDEDCLTNLSRCTS
jgi:hypothetical protein